jgi:hypothetical protein
MAWIDQSVMDARPAPPERSTEDRWPARTETSIESWDVEPEPTICPMCERVIPDDQQDAHHLVPKSKGGKKTVCLHRVCHDQIHAIFTDAQLAKKFSTIEAILEDPAVQKFVAWVKNKPPGLFRLGKGIAQAPFRAAGANSNSAKPQDGDDSFQGWLLRATRGPKGRPLWQPLRNLFSIPSASSAAASTCRRVLLVSASRGASR